MQVKHKQVLEAFTRVLVFTKEHPVEGAPHYADAPEVLEQAVQRRRRQEVGAADNVGDALGGVVDDHREVVGGAGVLAAEDDVALVPQEPFRVEGVLAGGLRAGLAPGEAGDRGGAAEVVDGGGEVEAPGGACGTQ